VADFLRIPARTPFGMANSRLSTRHCGDSVKTCSHHSGRKHQSIDGEVQRRVGAGHHSGQDNSCRGQSGLRSMPLKSRVESKTASAAWKTPCAQIGVPSRNGFSRTLSFVSAPFPRSDVTARPGRAVQSCRKQPFDAVPGPIGSTGESALLVDNIFERHAVRVFRQVNV
jgi:hypothetical protein